MFLLTCYRGRGILEDEVGKAAAVALSQGYEVTAFRELITEREEKNDAAEQNITNKQRTSQFSRFLLISCGRQLLREDELF